MDFLNDLLTGFIRPKKYKELLEKGTSRVVVYALILILISSVIAFLSLSKLSDATQKYYREVVPEFSFANNELNMSEPFKLELFGMIIAADSEKEFGSADFGDNIQGFLFDKNSMLLRSAAGTREFEYRELADDEYITFSKQDIYLLSPTFKIIFYIFLAFTIVYNAAGFFLGALIVALFALIPNRVSKLSFGKLYKLAVYSRGLPVILSLVLSSFIGPVPIIISFLISIIIVNIALTAISPKDDKRI